MFGATVQRVVTDHTRYECDFAPNQLRSLARTRFQAPARKILMTAAVNLGEGPEAN